MDQKDKDTGKLPAKISMAIRMNVVTEADIANGTRGEIEDIVLDEREETSLPR